jgi:hypothetical protein
MRRIIYLIVVAILCSLSFEGYSQLNRKNLKKNNRRIGSFRGKKSHFGKEKVYNSFGFGVNSMNYYGDLAPRPDKISTDISYTKPGFSLSFTHRFGPRYSLTASYLWGTLKGSDHESADPLNASGRSRYIRNLSFRNRINEFSLVANLDLFQNMATYISRVKWTPYVFLGIAVLRHNPQGLAPDKLLDGNANPDAGKWVDLRPLGTEGQYANLLDTDANHGIKPYKLIQPAIPFGVGARFRINPLIDVSAEVGFRYLFFDYIDDVSQNYIDLSLLPGDLAKAMAYRTHELVGDEKLATIGEPINEIPETARDGTIYNLQPGYGKEHPNNLRGNKKDNDVYMIVTAKLTYILGKTFHRAKFR